MEKITLVLAIVSILSVVPSYGQTSSPCNASMIISLAPCMNFITNSTSNGTSPTTACCDALKSVTSTNVDCACLLVTGNIPFQLPINRTLALSLPRACNTAGVPLQCKASGAPIPAPGPIALGPTLSPPAAPSLSPQAPSVPESESPALTPESNTPAVITPTTPVTPATPSGSRTVDTPSSSAVPSRSISSSVLLSVVGVLVIKYCYY